MSERQMRLHRVPGTDVRAVRSVMCEPCLYVMSTVEFRGASFFKIGITDDIKRRVAGVFTSCPLPIEVVLHLRMQLRGLALAAEQELHRALDAYRASGEWFKFEMDDDTAKQAFKDACASILPRHAGSNWKWSVLDLTNRERNAA